MILCCIGTCVNALINEPHFRVPREMLQVRVTLDLQVPNRGAVVPMNWTWALLKQKQLLNTRFNYHGLL